MNQKQANIEAKKRWGPEAYAKRYKPEDWKNFAYYVGLVEMGFISDSYEHCFRNADRSGNVATHVFPVF
jgi:hypothetical protein